MPFDLLQGDTVIWQNGEEVPAAMPWLNDMQGLLGRTALAVQLDGRAYWANESNAVGTQRNLRYMLPASIREEWDKEGELQATEPNDTTAELEGAT